jgi:hypothetical protein
MLFPPFCSLAASGSRILQGSSVGSRAVEPAQSEERAALMGNLWNGASLPTTRTQSWPGDRFLWCERGRQQGAGSPTEAAKRMRDATKRCVRSARIF